MALPYDPEALLNRDPIRGLFDLALNLTPPWKVAGFLFDPDGRRLDIDLDFERGARFACPQCGAADCPVHDTEAKEWRHLNFFQHEAYLHARVPRTRCERCGVHLVAVPWARKGSLFTLLFEALTMAMMREMPVKATGKIVGEHDTKLWRVLHHYVDVARAKEDFSGVRKVGVDETSHRRGQDYVTLFADLERSKVLFATPGRDHSTVVRFKEDLEAHGGVVGQVGEFTMDMSEAFHKGVGEQFEKAAVTVDRYHVVQQLNQAMDEIRRAEQRSHPDLKGSRYSWLKRSGNLTDKQRAELDEHRRRCRTMGRAYELKLEFEEFWELAGGSDEADAFLANWCLRVWESTMPIEPMKVFADTLVRNWERVLHWFESRIGNGILEAINSLVQAAKRRARGYRSTHNYIAMIYMTAGKLTFELPT